MKKARKAFWHNIRFKYKLSIVNENTLEEVVGIHVSKLNGLSVLLVFCAVIFFIASLIIVFTPLRNYLPGYMNSEVRAQVVANALRADSLQAALNRQNRYVINIRDILSGQVKADTVQSIDSLTDLREEELIARSQIEDEFRKQYEARERYDLHSSSVSAALNRPNIAIHIRRLRLPDVRNTEHKSSAWQRKFLQYCHEFSRPYRARSDLSSCLQHNFLF